MGHGIHQLDLLLTILGQWREVVAVSARQARPTATEDLSCAIVMFATGAVATMVNSLLSARQTSYLRFDFAHATVELEHLYGYRDQDWTITPAPGHTDTVAEAWAAGHPRSDRARVGVLRPDGRHRGAVARNADDGSRRCGVSGRTGGSRKGTTRPSRRRTD